MENPKERSLTGDLGSFLLGEGKKVNAFVRHSVSSSLCKEAALYMQCRLQKIQFAFPPSRILSCPFLMLKIETVFGPEPWSTSGTVSYRKM